MIIRKAKLKDLNQIIDFALDLLKIHEDFDPFFKPAKDARKRYYKHFKRCIYSRNSHLLVVEENGKLLGYSLGEINKRSPVFKLREIGYISDVYVTASARKKGIAKLFLKELFAWFKSKKIHCIELIVHAENDIATKAWSKCGFEHIESRRRIMID